MSRKTWRDAIGDMWRVVKLVAIISVPMGLLFFHVFNQYRIAALGYEVADQTREHRELIEEHRKLRIEASFQGRSDRMTAVARERFGLEPIHPEQVIGVTVGDDPRQAALGERASLDLRGE